MAVRKRKSKPKEEFGYVFLEIKSAEISVGCSINPDLKSNRGKPYAYSEKAFEVRQHIEITGAFLYPKEEAGDRIELSIYGSETEVGEWEAGLGAFQTKDKNGFPKYRRCGEFSYPVYDPPWGFGLFEKVRGKPGCWSGHARLPPALLSDMIQLVLRREHLYLGIYTRVQNRAHWITDIALTTQNEVEA